MDPSHEVKSANAASEVKRAVGIAKFAEEDYKVGNYYEAMIKYNKASKEILQFFETPEAYNDLPDDEIDALAHLAMIWSSDSLKCKHMLENKYKPPANPKAAHDGDDDDDDSDMEKSDEDFDKELFEELCPHYVLKTLC